MCRPLQSFNVFALAILGALVLARPAGAEEKPEEQVTEYRETVARAVDLFDSGRYEAARRAFRRAYRIHPDPVLLFNIGSTYRREGDAARALELYRRFLDEAPPDEPRRAIAKETIADLEARLAERRAAEEAEDPLVEEPIAADGDADSPEPIAPAAFAGAGPRDAGEPNDPGRTLRWSGIATAVVGGIGLGAAWLEWDRARDAEETIESLPSGTPWSDKEAAIYEQGRASHERSQWLVWTGGALVATGAVLYLVGVHREGDADLAVQLTAGDSSARMMVRGSF